MSRSNEVRKHAGSLPKPALKQLQDGVCERRQLLVAPLPSPYLHAALPYVTIRRNVEVPDEQKEIAHASSKQIEIPDRRRRSGPYGRQHRQAPQGLRFSGHCPVRRQAVPGNQARQGAGFEGGEKAGCRHRGRQHDHHRGYRRQGDAHDLLAKRRQPSGRGGKQDLHQLRHHNPRRPSRGRKTGCQSRCLHTRGMHGEQHHAGPRRDPLPDVRRGARGVRQGPAGAEIDEQGPALRRTQRARRPKSRRSSTW